MVQIRKRERKRGEGKHYTDLNFSQYRTETTTFQPIRAQIFTAPQPISRQPSNQDADPNFTGIQTTTNQIKQKQTTAVRQPLNQKLKPRPDAHVPLLTDTGLHLFKTSVKTHEAPPISFSEW